MIDISILSASWEKYINQKYLEDRSKCLIPDNELASKIILGLNDSTLARERLKEYGVLDRKKFCIVLFFETLLFKGIQKFKHYTTKKMEAAIGYNFVEIHGHNGHDLGNIPQLALNGISSWDDPRTREEFHSEGRALFNRLLMFHSDQFGPKETANLLQKMLDDPKITGKSQFDHKKADGIAKDWTQIISSYELEYRMTAQDLICISNS